MTGIHKTATTREIACDVYGLKRLLVTFTVSSEKLLLVSWYFLETLLVWSALPPVTGIVISQTIKESAIAVISEIACLLADARRYRHWAVWGGCGFIIAGLLLQCIDTIG